MNLSLIYSSSRASQVVLMVKNLPAKAGDIRDVGLILGLGRCFRGGNGNPLQYSCLENPHGQAAWRATVHGITNSWTQVKWLSTYSSSNNLLSIIQALNPRLGSEERDKVSCYATFWSGNSNNIYLEWKEDLPSNE